MKPLDQSQILRKRIILTILFMCFGLTVTGNATETAKPFTGKQVPYSYSNYDAVISGLASTTETDSTLTVSGSFYNNYWNPLCDIDVYLTIIKKNGVKGKRKRFYLGDLLEGETGTYELAITPSKEIDSLELTFIYEICSTRHETPADFITITIPWSSK